MSDDEMIFAMEELKSQFSKDRKKFQAQITSIKHSFNRNDKKKKKEISALIESMEKELKDRHESEIKKLNNNFANKMKISNGEVNEIKEDNLANDEKNDTKEKRKPSKAQINRAKKAEEVKRRLIAAEQDKKNAKFSPSNIENNEIKRVLCNRHLILHEIQPDGDCLYNSLAHQLNKEEFSGAELRKIAAKYIYEHSDVFLPFLINAENNLIDKFSLDDYCDKVEKVSQKGGAWGGEAELRAISAALKCTIEVLQSNGRSFFFGEEFISQKPLIVTYHRFAYTLGEHYNSTTPLPLEIAEEE